MLRLLIPTPLVAFPLAAHAQGITLYGMNRSPMMGGGFAPSDPGLVCTATRDGKCFDGKVWHPLFPPGPHKFSRAQGTVACRVIIRDDGSCWDGSAWNRLPRGTIQGTVGGILGPTPGAFITTPLPP